jgi:hypothetical protein
MQDCANRKKPPATLTGACRLAAAAARGISECQESRDFDIGITDSRT